MQVPNLILISSLTVLSSLQILNVVLCLGLQMMVLQGEQDFNF